MGPQYILHIGMNKTGSTSLQRFFSDNYRLFARNKLLYPRTGRKNNAHYYLGRMLGFGTRLDLDRTDLSALVKQTRRKLDREISAREAKKVLISCENFVQPRNMARLKRFFAGNDVTVLVYLRRHDYWIESCYHQAVKMFKHMPWCNGIDAYLEHLKKKQPHHGKFRELVDNWAAIFGKQNIIVRPFEPGQNQPSLFHDFLRSAGLTGFIDGIEIPQWRMNESPFTEKPIMSNLIREQLVMQNQSDYDYIAREYMGRKNESLFFEPISREII